MGRPAKFDTDEALEQAMNVFWIHGYAGTTPQMLTTELGIGKGSFYHSFDSKHNLFALALQRYYCNRCASVAAIIAQPGPMFPKLHDIMLMLTGVGGHQRGCLIVNAIGELAGPDESVARVAADLFDMIATEFTRAIESGRTAGEFVADTEPAAAAQSLLATVLGVSVLAKTNTDHDQLSRVLRDALTAVC